MEDVDGLATAMPHVTVGHGPGGNPIYLPVDGHPSVLLRAARAGELTSGTRAGLVQDAWLARALPTCAADWLRRRGAP